MDAQQLELARKLAAIFMPFAKARQDAVKAQNIKFVYYTNADTALKILKDKQVYMRSTVCMNDYREFEHGMDYLVAFFADPAKKKGFFDAVNACNPNLADEAVRLFDQWLPANRMNIYVTCISEHDPSEDKFGRLSMWRAYGRGAIRVAIVMNNEPFFLVSDVLKVYGSPVGYFPQEQFHTELDRVVANVKENCEFLKGVPRANLINVIFYMLLFAAACSKHPGFKEEREWRVLHMPKMHTSSALLNAVETIDGVPQIVYKIPLKNIPEEGLTGIEIPQLVHKVIIGPSIYPWPLYEAFVSVLKDAGVENAEERVVVSDIPLRTYPS